MALFESESLETSPDVAARVAGAGLNVRAAAARLGIASAFCSRVGDDPLGGRVRRELTRLGIQDLLVSDPDRPTGLFLKEIRPDGQRRVYYYRSGSAASALDGGDAERLLATGPGLVVVSGITAALGPAARAAVLALARYLLLGLDEAEYLFGRSDRYNMLLKSPAETVLEAGADSCFFLDDHRPSGHRGRRRPSDPGAGLSRLMIDVAILVIFS